MHFESSDEGLSLSSSPVPSSAPLSAPNGDVVSVQLQQGQRSNPADDEDQQQQQQQDSDNDDVDNSSAVTEIDVYSDSSSSSSSIEQTLKTKKRKSRVLSSTSSSETEDHHQENKKKIKMLSLKDSDKSSEEEEEEEEEEKDKKPSEEEEKDKIPSKLKKVFNFKDKSSSYDQLQENADGQLTDNSLNLNELVDIDVEKEIIVIDSEDEDNHQLMSDFDVGRVKKENIDSSSKLEDHKSFNNQLFNSENVEIEAGNVKVVKNSLFEDDDVTEITTTDTGNFFIKSASTGKTTNDPNHLEIGEFRGILVNDGTTGEFNGFFQHSEDLRKKLQETFGHRDFRPIQQEAMNAALLNHDCFILMPSGGGKSLCFQLPALLSEGLTVVITPSKAHLIDQVMKLDALGVLVGYLSDDPNFIKQNNDILHILEHNSTPILKLLYVTPDKLSQSAHLNHVLQLLYQRGLLTRFVFDEAHCVSRWGNDFRKEYTEFPNLKIAYPNVPTTALTATSTPTVRADILSQLSIPRTKWFHCSLNRPNLKYEVRPKAPQNQSMVDLVLLLRSPQFINGSGIVFCFTRKECEAVASQLSRNGIMALSYHAGHDDKKRNKIHHDWRTNKVRIICSTTAFGAGIDKPDVRIVVHFFIPKSIENYYQETGRAGRDGLNANCILFYSFNDVNTLQRIILGSKNTIPAKKVMLEGLVKMVAFCQNDSDCRRVFQLEHLGENFNADRCRGNKATACDNCSTEETYVVKDVTEESKEFVQAILDICGSAGEPFIFNKKFTQSHFVDVFKGSMIKKVKDAGHNKISLHGKGKTWLKKDIENLVRRLIAENYLVEESISSKNFATFSADYLRCGSKGNDLLEGRVKLAMPISIVKQKKGAPTIINIGNNKSGVKMPNLMAIRNPAAQGQGQSSSSANSSAENEFGQIQLDAYRELVMECLKISTILGLPNWSSLVDYQVLRTMSVQLPETLDDILEIPGVSKANFELYGSRLLLITKKYAEEKRLKMVINQPQLNASNMGNMSSIDAIVRNVGYQVSSMNNTLFYQRPEITAAVLAAQQTQAWLARGYTRGRRGGGGRRQGQGGGHRGGRGGRRTFASTTTNTAPVVAPAVAGRPQPQPKKSRKK